MDKSKLEAKLEQAQTKRNTIFADIESLQSNEKEADKEIASIKAEIETLNKKPEVIYSIGDRFKDSKGGKVFLCNGGHSDIHFVNLKGGTGEGEPFRAICNSLITEAELRLSKRDHNLTRYWDDRKKEYTDSRDDKKADLKALDKPELRHGDYGRNSNGVPFIIQDNKIVWMGDNGHSKAVSNFPNSTVYPKHVLGNLKEVFDDLAAIGEGQDKFTVDNSCYYEIHVIDTDGTIHIKQDGSTIVLSTSCLHDFILGLRGIEVKLKTK